MVPIFERFIYPSLRKVRINFSPIKRITAGFVVAGLGGLHCFSDCLYADPYFSHGVLGRAREISLRPVAV
jgi:hypothetical protein